MRQRVGRLPVRVRLVAGFSVAMLVLLTGAGAFVYWRVQYALDRGLDVELAQSASVIAPLVGVDGTVTARDSADATGLAWQVLDADGRVLDAGGPAPDRVLLDGTGVRAGTYDVGSMLPVSDAPYRVRVGRLAGSTGPAAYLLVGVRRDHRDEALRELVAQLATAGLAALVVASAVGYGLARLALDPVERYRRRADEIAGGAAHLRLDVATNRDDEVTRLGHTLNRMLAALEESLDRERQFVQDASHELRTPLTLLTSRIQLTRRRVRSVEEHEVALDELAVDVARLTELTEQLLDLGRTPPPGLPGSATDAGASAAAVAARWTEPVTVRRPAAPVCVAVDPTTLERILTNLVGNALTHGAAPVEVRVRREGGEAILEVVDAGPGFSEELLPVATRRFHRAPEARARPGAGLGLSIVEHLVSDAGGRLRLSSDRPTTVTVVLPAD